MIRLRVGWTLSIRKRRTTGGIHELAAAGTTGSLEPSGGRGPARRGPQVITANGEETAVVVSIEEYRRLQLPSDTLADFLMHSPLRRSGIRIEGDQVLERDLDP